MEEIGAKLSLRILPFDDILESIIYDGTFLSPALGEAMR